MASDSFYALRNIMPLFFGGRDQYTQNHWPSVVRSSILNKGTEWVDTSDSNKFNLYNTTGPLKLVFDRKAMMKSTGQWKHKRWTIDKEGKRVAEDVLDSPWVKKLENPNVLQDGNMFSVQSSLQMSIYGNNVQYVPVGSISREPKMLWNLPANQISMNLTGKMYKQNDVSKIIEKYILNNTNNGQNEDYEVKDILHFRIPHPNNPILGLSPLEGIMMEISNIRGAMGFRNRIIRADGALGILSSDVTSAMGGMASMPLEPKEQRKIKKARQSRFGMQDGKEDYLMTEAAVKWQSMSFPTKDLMLFEEVDSDLGAIIDAIGLNVHMFYISPTNTYENLKNGIILAYTQCIIPEGEAEGLMYTKHFGMDPNVEWLCRDYSHLEILKIDTSTSMKTKAEGAKVLQDMGVSPERISIITDMDLGNFKKPEPKLAAPGSPIATV